VPRPLTSLPTRLARALARGAAWNWVYWKAVIHADEREVLVASVPQRLVQAVERGEMTRRHAAQLLASRDSPSLEVFTPYVPLWSEALSLLLSLRVDARRATLFGQTAQDLALEGRWREAFDAASAAASIERAYSGRVVKWRALLGLITQELVHSSNGLERFDSRIQSAAEATLGDSTSRHEGRRRPQRS